MLIHTFKAVFGHSSLRLESSGSHAGASRFVKPVEPRFFSANAVPPNKGMKLTGLKRPVPCKREEQRPRRFSPAAYPRG